MHINKGYSRYINPLLISLDLCIIISLLTICYSLNLSKLFTFGLYQIVAWIIISYYLKTYEIFRFTTLVEITSKLVKHFAIFTLAVLAYSTIFNLQINLTSLTYNVVSVFVIIYSFKFLFFFYVKRYRMETGKNTSYSLLIGDSKEVDEFRILIDKRKDFGYQIVNENNLTIESVSSIIKEKTIDTIFCSISEFSNNNITHFTELADQYKIKVKIIPEYRFIYAKNIDIHYLDHLPIITFKNSPLDEELSKFFKRSFDVVFSLCVIVFILSWLIPLLGLLIKLESRGPIFFKQSRPGIFEQEFFCIKFRSMRPNTTTEKEASRNDPRVTKIGKFIRKTSLDEMPQFINVLIGDMSIVGPRPHLWTQNKTYGPKLKKYMSRHQVKPGITGLAQVRGFRGEIETDFDMINRIKYDNFYIENWSILLDIKIIIQTVINIFKGEEKAY